ncbi:hypothetical protein ERO13_A02G102300v2 [Gossypium hirsutum]|uniref:COP1-interactive protein 1 n=1 Tax=Gossypium hirsutum TaxID=3635 RepID=A0A1U8NXU0_GOSHI|nr:COP1-interactive protein 1-like [Gossypium hirsutum]XP_040941587.1 COP1-interactive protein 1-like [Gossypium hirsutum]KAG4211411.1 hypothetical protein ERO13_A02G102300v2 [Gossypium hirsutum]KAG4211412.1 hypothetical protein ERO13_A02G102300v2 [Gossypium hirsutum]
MEQVEVIKPDVEKRVERILKLIKRKSRKREPELIGHVEEFYRQYQSLSAQYEHLKRESVEKVLKGKGKGNESHPYYSSGSDSEYYSPTDRENDTDTTFDNDRRFHRWMADNIKEELNRAYEEDADLKHQLASKTEESEALASGHLSASSKTEEIETINKDEPKRDSEVGIDGKTVETKQQGETNTAMYVPVWEEGDEVTKLMKQLKENEKNLTSRINNSMAQVCSLKKEVDYLRAQQCEARGNVMKPELEVQVKTLKEENQGLQVQVIDLESEVDALRKQNITSKDELRSNVHEINQLKEENAHLNSRILGLEALFRERRLEDCQTKREKQITQMSTEVKLDHVTEKNQVELQIADQQRMMKEIEEHTRKTMERNPKLIKQLSAGNKLNYIERKMGNLAQEFYQKLDDNIRLLCLRIAVAEKKHYENKENYKNIKESLEQENKELKQKLVTCETELTKLIDNAEKKRENDEVSNSEEEQKLKLLKAVSVLEKKVGELEKINKEKDATLLSREEEKREAIRQLCLLIDYHRTNCDYLKELVSELTVRIKKKI